MNHHRLTDVEHARTRDGYRAVCACGWRSRIESTRADAIERHATHRERETPPPALPYRTIIR